MRDEHNYKQRHLHPSVYKKVIKTKELIKQNVDPREFTSRGGLDLETFNILKKKYKREERLIEEDKTRIINKYGSLEAAPLKKGPCRCIDPVIGTKNALVLLTEFSDVKHTTHASYFQDFLFSEGSNRSMRDYYLEASWNQLDINGMVHDQWFTADGKVADYIDLAQVKGDFPHSQKLVSETILQATKSGIDFKPFARDGKIELLIIIYAGEGMDTSLNIKSICPHQDKITKPIEVQKGIWADNYCLIPEFPLDDLGCFCHEVAHILGLPDLYKLNYSPVVGSWCLMGVGDHIENGKRPSHPSAWCKVHLGWRKPILIKDPPKLRDIPAVIDEEGVIYKVEVDGSNGGEYFLLENRQKKGFDSHLPDSGLLIWHINENVCIHSQPNSDPEHFFLTLVQSDGKNELQRDMKAAIKELGKEAAEKDLWGDEGDAYPGRTLNRNFNENSAPNSDCYDGTKSKINVTSISDSGDLMEAQIGVKNQSTIPSAASPSIKQDEARELKYYELFVNLMASEDNLNPYQEGYEAGKLDVIENLKEEEDLDFYRRGYREGYFQGFKNALKKLK